MPLGVTPQDNVQTQLLFASNAVFPTLGDAAFIGGLSANKTDLSVQSQVSSNVPVDYYKFNFEQGTGIKLATNNLTNTSSLRFQILDVAGNVIADNYGTPTQQAAYNQLDSDSGLNAATGSYYVQVSYAPGATTSDQNYNFQLYSGTTYTNSIVTSAQTQAYDPNLFVSASASVSPSSNLSLYTQSASIPSIQTSSNGVNLGNLVSNSTELDAVSSLTAANRGASYSFDFQEGSTIKLAVSNTTNALDAVPLRAQLIDSKGNVLADNYGTAAQKQAYEELQSGVGLAASNGQYHVNVSAAPGVPVNAAQSYNFQLISGTSYETVYKTTATLPTAKSANAAGTNLTVFASSQAQAYSRQGYNAIGATALSALNIGWLSENTSALSVQSQLSPSDTEDVYSFNLQQGSSIKLGFADTNSADSASPIRIQLLDPSGTYVYADNEGTAAQKANYAKLTSADGLASNAPSTYIVKIAYAQGATHTTTQNYNFQVYSGSTYNNEYTTIASAQTYENAVLSGNTNVGGYNPNAAAASYLNSVSQGTGSDITSILSSLA